MQLPVKVIALVLHPSLQASSWMRWKGQCSQGFI